LAFYVIGLVYLVGWIPERMFARVQWVLKGGSKAPPKYRTDNAAFPLRRFVSCGLCGLPLTGSAPKGRSKTYAYYHCRKCKRVRVATTALESEFVALLERLQPKPDFMKLFRAIVLVLLCQILGITPGSERKRA
jgi:site-specific DNA recombinase